MKWIMKNKGEKNLGIKILFSPHLPLQMASFSGSKVLKSYYWLEDVFNFHFGKN